jgi:hypothetical protein
MLVRCYFKMAKMWGDTRIVYNVFVSKQYNKMVFHI